MVNTMNCFIKSNVDITAASSWLQRLLRRFGHDYIVPCNSSVVRHDLLQAVATGLVGKLGLLCPENRLFTGADSLDIKVLHAARHQTRIVAKAALAEVSLAVASSCLDAANCEFLRRVRPLSEQ